MGDQIDGLEHLAFTLINCVGNNKHTKTLSTIEFSHVRYFAIVLVVS